MALRNIKLIISYDGVDYHGWQSQPGQRTVQEELERAISNLVGFHVKVKAASRTDAGVSALGQVVSFKIDSPVPTERLAQAITRRLPRDIEVLEAVEMDDSCEPSASAKSKLYRYTIFTGKKRNVLQSRNCWRRPRRLDIEAMNRAANLLVGTKDFKSFAAAADKRESSIRTVMQCRVTQEDKWIYIDIEADRFLYNMVRNIVGTLVEVGRGRWPAEKVNEILEAKDRTTAGPIAPAEGLCLMWVKY
jgi:tRNA pseudouridine38-40 synthase